MTRHEQYESVRELVNNHIPFRSSPIPQLRERMHIAIPDTASTIAPISGIKRSTPTHDYTTDIHSGSTAQAHKRPRRDSITTPKTPESHDEILRGRRPSLSRSAGAGTRSRTNSPALSFTEAAETMMSRAEELGGNRTTPLARGLPASPVPPRPSSRPSVGNTNGMLANQKTNARTNSTWSEWLDNVGLREFFQQDERPIFILDLDLPTDPIPIVFTNQALQSRPTLFDSVHGTLEDAAVLLDAGVPFADFKT